MPDERPLTIVSNRGPGEFTLNERGERIVRRGGGGLVTALSGLVSHRKALWIASAMTEEDIAVAEQADGEAMGIEVEGVSYDVCLVASDPAAYDLLFTSLFTLAVLFEYELPISENEGPVIFDLSA